MSDRDYYRPAGKGSKKKPGNNAKYDWNLMRDHYVYGYVVTDESTGQRSNAFPTYADLAEKFNCPVLSIRQKGAKENWTTLQAEYRETLDKQRQIESFKSPELSEQEQFNARILWDINKLFGVLEGLFEQYEYLELGVDGHFHFRMPNTKLGYSEDDPDGKRDIQPIRVSDLKGIVDILDKLHILSSRITAAQDAKFENKSVSELSSSDIETLLKQRDSLMRQLDGRTNGSE
jgi:hypothetical protein